jgi:hypothetical protein
VFVFVVFVFVVVITKETDPTARKLRPIRRH